MNFCPPRSSTGKWVVLQRELGGNAVGEKFVMEGIGVGYWGDPQWAKKSTPPVRGGEGRGGGWILKNHSSCTDLTVMILGSCRLRNTTRSRQDRTLSSQVGLPLGCA